MRLKGKKIGVLYRERLLRKGNLLLQAPLPRRGCELHFLTRLWGQPSLTFNGHEEHTRSSAARASRTWTTRRCAATRPSSSPSGIVADRLRYTGNPNKLRRRPNSSSAPSRRSHRQGHHLPRHVAGGAGDGAGARPQGRRPQQPGRRRQGIGRDLHRSGRRRRRRPGDGADRRPLPRFARQIIDMIAGAPAGV